MNHQFKLSFESSTFVFLSVGSVEATTPNMSATIAFWLEVIRDSHASPWKRRDRSTGLLGKDSELGSSEDAGSLSILVAEPT